MMRGAWILVFVALLSSCATIRGEQVETGFGPDDRAPSAPAVVADPETVIEIGDGPAAAAFEFQSLELGTGEPVFGADLYAERSLIMTFVAPTCPVCVTEGPKLAAAALAHPELTYVVVHTGAEVDDYTDFVTTYGLDAPNVVHIRDDDGALWRRFGIVAQPSTLLLAADGSLTSSTGALGDDGLERAAALVA